MASHTADAPMLYGALRLDPQPGELRAGAIGRADEVTLSRKKSGKGPGTRTHGRAVRSTRARASARVARKRGTQSDPRRQLAARERELAEALEQQTATAEILECDQQFAYRHAAGVRRHRAERIEVVSRRRHQRRARGRGAGQGCGGRRAGSRARRGVAAPISVPAHARLHAQRRHSGSQNGRYSRRPGGAGRACGRRPELPGERLPGSDHDADDARQRRNRCPQRRARGARAAHGQAARGAADVREPGRHRHREHAAAQRAARIAAAADRDRRRAQGDHPLGLRPASGARYPGRVGCQAVRSR